MRSAAIVYESRGILSSSAGFRAAKAAIVTTRAATVPSVTRRAFLVVPSTRTARSPIERRSEGFSAARPSVAPQELQNLSPGSYSVPQRGQYTRPSYQRGPAIRELD